MTQILFYYTEPSTEPRTTRKRTKKAKLTTSKTFEISETLGSSGSSPKKGKSTEEDKKCLSELLEDRHEIVLQHRDAIRKKKKTSGRNRYKNVGI